METLQNKVAIVTGSSQGIGRAIALRLGRLGCRVALTARDETKLKGVAEEIRKAGGSAICIPIDLRQPTAAEQIVAKTLEAFQDIDIVVNNAGATPRGEFVTLNDEAWQDGFALKFFGAVRLTRAAWKHLSARKGSVVSIAGIGGRTPGAEFSIGGSVNAALLSLTKSLADTGIKDGVQVNAISPGSVRTDRLTLRLANLAKERGISAQEAESIMIKEAKVTRFGEPEDIAHMVAFVVSVQGRFMHGSLIDMDGGATKTL